MYELPMGVTLIIHESETMPRFELFSSLIAAQKRILALRADDDFFGCAYIDGERVLAKDTSAEELVFVDNRVSSPSDVADADERETQRSSAPKMTALRPPELPTPHSKVPALRPPEVPSTAIDPFDLDAVTRSARQSVELMVATQRQCSKLVLQAGEEAQAVVAKAIKQSLETGAVAQANARQAVRDSLVSRAEMLSVLDTERALRIAQTAHHSAHALNKKEAAVVAATRGAPAQPGPLAKISARVWDYWGK